MMAESKFFMGYSRWLEEESRYETWEEAVERVMNMHREKYAHVMTDELEQLIAFAEAAYKEKRVLGAQRALQFGGEQIFKHVARMYNCVSTHINRPQAFQETMYLLLCGCGVGFSVQNHHIDMLPQFVNVTIKGLRYLQYLIQLKVGLMPLECYLLLTLKERVLSLNTRVVKFTLIFQRLDLKVQKLVVASKLPALMV